MSDIERDDLPVEDNEVVTPVDETPISENDATEAAPGGNEDTDVDGDAATEPSVEEQKEPFVSVLFDYVEILAFSVCAVLLLFTLFFRLCQVSGPSMNNTLENGEMLITANLAKPEAGDIIVFHMTNSSEGAYNKPLVKRIIATEGQTVRIDYATATVSVDGVTIDEDYAALLGSNGTDVGFMTLMPNHHFDIQTGVFEMTVPEGQLFVMGDNRNHSADSRVSAIGCIDERQVLGKVICRLSPFTTFD